MNEKQYQNARAGNGHNGENFAFSGNTHHSVIFENDAHILLPVNVYDKIFLHNICNF